VADLLSGSPDQALAVAGETVSAAMAAGASAAEAFIRTGPAERLTWRGPRLVTETRGMQCEAVVRVWRGGRSLAVTANTIAGLAHLARSAVEEVASHGHELAPCLREGPARERFTGSSERPGGDPSLAEALAEVSAMPGLGGAQLTAVCSRRRQWNVLANSLDLAAAYEMVQRVSWLWADWPRGRIGEAETGGADAVLTCGRRLAGQAALMSGDSARPPAGSAAVLLAPASAAHLARALGGLLTGDNLARGLGALLERRGDRIASAAMDLTDAPRRPGGTQTRPIDDEGTPTREVPLLRSGRLVGLLHSLRSACEAGDQPTGSARRPALHRLPVAGPSNVRVEPGTESRDHLRLAMGAGIEVESLGRPGRIQDGTGNFTLVGHGWMVESGERSAPLRGVPLSANVFELLRAVRARGDDLTYVPLADGAGAPSLLLDRMRVGLPG